MMENESDGKQTLAMRIRPPRRTHGATLIVQPSRVAAFGVCGVISDAAADRR